MTASVSQSEWRRFRTCPRQFVWGKSRPRERTTDRDRRTLLGVTVDAVIGRMYEERWLTNDLPLLVVRLNAAAREVLAAKFPEYSVPDTVEMLAYELQPLWLNILPTVTAHRLLSPVVHIRRDYSMMVGDVQFWGQPDLVFANHFDDTTADIVDVKLRSKSSLEAKQVRVYQLLVESLGTKVSRMGYWLPRDGEIVWKQVMRRGARTTMLRELADDLTRLVAGDEQPVTGTHCVHCEVRGDCAEGAVYIREKFGSVLRVTGSAYEGKPVVVGF